MKTKKIYLIKIEVTALSIQKAIKSKGRVIEITEIKELERKEKKEMVGFNK